MTDYPKLNVELLDKTLDYIEAYPEEHDQSAWICGTKMCFAGHALCQAGHTLASSASLAECDKVELDGKKVWFAEVPELASDELGLTHREMTILFYQAITLHDVRRTVENIKDGFYRP